MAADPSRAITKAPIQTVFIVSTLRSRVTRTLPPFNGFDQRPVPGEAALMKPEGAAPRAPPPEAYSGNGGVSPSGRPTWNTLRVFPISV